MERLTRKKRHKICDAGRHPTEYTSRQLLRDLQAQFDMYGGDLAITDAFQKAEERDAAVEDLRGLCWCCAHGKKYENGLPWSRATTCKHMRELGVAARAGGKCKCQFWEWRGMAERLRAVEARGKQKEDEP